MPLFLTENHIEVLNTEAKVIGICPYRTETRTSGWQPDLWAEQRRIRVMEVGEAMLTSGRNFDAKCGIITKPPIWEGGRRKEELYLAACYDACLRLATKRRCKTIAFPLLSGDCNGFPRDLALKVASETISDYLERHYMMVYLSVKSGWRMQLPRPPIPGLEDGQKEKTLSTQQLFEAAIRQKKTMNGADETAQASAMGGENLSEVIVKIVDEKGFNDYQVSQKANLEPFFLNKMREDRNYRPDKTTALSLLVALELPYEQIEKILKDGGCPLQENLTRDRIVRYYISQGEYDVFKINLTLFAYHEPMLGQGD